MKHKESEVDLARKQFDQQIELLQRENHEHLAQKDHSIEGLECKISDLESVLKILKLQIAQFEN